ncbi:lysozyme [Sphingomonas sp. LY29]|uniref:lysozyme n=1 Tax=Sphingomonas sp. LY29 TaxID=3095341 RepID=UPI002D7888EF|nr:lysozyme [Sphingomonas sp. LY29]WRP25668.1 lysozyme [Sphingomonas sp. LY29]
MKLLDAAIDASVAFPVAQPAQRRISDKGLALVKVSEGLRLGAYRCPADVPTIGYGSTGAHVKMGMTITEAEAEKLLLEDLSRFEKGVAEMGGKMTQGEFDALVSFAFNLGLGALSNSTLLKKHKAGDRKGAALEFKRWVNAGGRKLPGLVKRREAERKLYTGEA